MNSIAAQALGGGDLGGDDAFCVAGAASVDAGCIFGGGDERGDGIHVGGENYFRVWVIGQRGVDVEARAFHRNFPRLVADAGKFSVEIVGDGGFVAGDGFDVDELAGEGDGVHE